jgi:UDPglucose 6-dehydrogenase
LLLISLQDWTGAIVKALLRRAIAIGADRRTGDKFLHPGPGYGGSCFPKDVAALIRMAREARSPLSLIEQVQTVNTERKIAMASRIERAAGGKLAGKLIAVLGVTSKPDTDDGPYRVECVPGDQSRRAERSHARQRPRGSAEYLLFGGRARRRVQLYLRREGHVI